MKKELVAAIAVFAFVLPLTAGRPVIAAETDSATPAVTHKYPQGILFPYSLLDAATHGNIDDQGNINYLKIKDDKNLAQFMEAISNADLTQFPTFDVQVTDPKTGRVTKTVTDRSAELVFWINAYNGSVIYTIAQQYPIKSIDKIKNFDTEETHLIAGQKYSFENLRKKIAGFDPRALLTLISGTKGGVLPAKDAYRFTNLSANLDAAVRLFVNTPDNININRIQNTVTINDTFKLFDAAFAPKKDRRKWGGIRYLISAYVERGADQRYLTNSEYEIQFAPANHDLNDITHNN